MVLQEFAQNGSSSNLIQVDWNNLEKPTSGVKFEAVEVGISKWRIISFIRGPNSSIPHHRRLDSIVRVTLIEAKILVKNFAHYNITVVLIQESKYAYA
jgi:hypothetical protein